MPTGDDSKNLPAAQGSTGQPTTDAGSSQPPSNGTGSPPAASSGDDSERRRLAAQGREMKEIREQNQALQNVVIGLQKQLSDLGGSLNAREEREQQALLDSLPPEERLEKRIEMLGRRIDGMQSRTTQPVIQTEDPVAYQQRKMEEIRAQVNEEFPGADITSDEVHELAERGALDLTSPETYTRSLKLIAAANTRGKPATAPQNGQTQGGVGNGQGGTMPQGTTDQNNNDEVERRAQEIADQELRKYGIARPNSARAAIPAGPVTSEGLHQLSRNFGSNMSPRQRQAAIQKARQQR